MIEIPLSKATSLISPRLTVLVNTIDERGKLNSSPYSWVYPLSSNPPLIGVGIGGKNKYTYINAERNGEFVVCIVSADFGQQAINCEKNTPPGTNSGKNKAYTRKNQKKSQFPESKNPKPS